MVFEGVVEGPPLLLLLEDVFFERFLMDAHTKKNRCKTQVPILNVLAKNHINEHMSKESTYHL